MKATLHIFKKELLELRRDKRTFYSVVVGPVFLIYLMLASLSLVERSFTQPASQKLHVVTGKGSNAFLDALKQVKELKIIEVASMGEGRKLLLEGNAKVVVEFRPMAPGKPIQLDAVYDSDEIKAKVLMSILEQAAAKLNDAKVDTLLDGAGISKDERASIRIDKEPLTRSKPDGPSPMSGMLPYLIVIWAFYGAFGIASEAVAAEKEKQTLETLLIAPVRRRDIAIGKFLSLFAIALTSCLVSIASIAILGPLVASKSVFAGGLQITPMAMLTMIAVIVPLCAMFGGLLLAVSAFARNVRECQTYLTLISFIVLIPAVFSQFLGFTDFSRAGWLSYVPILNTASVLRQALLDKIEPQAVVITIVLTLILAVASIIWAIRMFEREKILVRI